MKLFRSLAWLAIILPSIVSAQAFRPGAPVTDTNPYPVKVVSGGGGGGGGGGDASATNQSVQIAAEQEIRDRLGALTSPAAGSANALLRGIGASLAAPLPVTQSGTWNLTNITGTVSLPTGAATSALQTSGNTSLSTIATNTAGKATEATLASQSTGISATATSTAAIDSDLGAPADAAWQTGNGTVISLLKSIASGRRESFQLIAANTPSAAVTVFGGDYIISQTCTAYGTVTLQVLGPDGATWLTLGTFTGTDTGNGTGGTIGSYAQIRMTVSGTSGCNAVLARVPS